MTAVYTVVHVGLERHTLTTTHTHTHHHPQSVAIGRYPRTSQINIANRKTTNENRNIETKQKKFLCTCRACTIMPDRCRAFRCPSKDCRNGKVCPHGDGGDGDGAEDRSPNNWGCLDCGHQCSAPEISRLLAAEESLAQAMEDADVLGACVGRCVRVWCTAVPLFVLRPRGRACVRASGVRKRREGMRRGGGGSQKQQNASRPLTVGGAPETLMFCIVLYCAVPTRRLPPGLGSKRKVDSWSSANAMLSMGYIRLHCCTAVLL